MLERERGINQCLNFLLTLLPPFLKFFPSFRASLFACFMFWEGNLGHQSTSIPAPHPPKEEEEEEAIRVFFFSPFCGYPHTREVHSVATYSLRLRLHFASIEREKAQAASAFSFLSFAFSSLLLPFSAAASPKGARHCVCVRSIVTATVGTLFSAEEGKHQHHTHQVSPSFVRRLLYLYNANNLVRKEEGI